MITTEKDIRNLRTISDFVYYYAEIQPDVDAMVLKGDRITYKEMAEEVDKCAQALVALGVKKGDRIATLCPPSPDFFVLFLATASVGAIWMGLNPKNTYEELRYVILDARPRLIFSRTEIVSKKSVRNYKKDLINIKNRSDTVEYIVALDETDVSDLGLTYAQFLSAKNTTSLAVLRDTQNSVDRKDSALLVYTSGTTGKPKGALLPHGGLIECCVTQNRILNCSPVKFVNFLPINHIGCVGDISCSTLVAGGTILFLEQFDAEKNLKLIRDEKVTIWGGVPTTFLMCLSHPNFSHYDLSSLQLILWSGGAAPKDLVVTLSKIHPRLSNCYGQTEAVGSITFISPTNDIDILSNTVGKPPENYDVKIVDKDGKTVSNDEVGEVVVRGDFIMNGYWNRPEETKKTIDENGYLHTGDLATRRVDGNICLVGRIKEMIKSGGYNIYPREIEQVLESFPGIDMAAVIAVKDPIFDEVGHAFILDPRQVVDEEALREHCRKFLANYKIPKSFTISSELPMLPIGKIDKMALKKSIN